MMIKFWRIIPAGLAHKVSPFFLNLSFPIFREKNPDWDVFEWRGLKFPNRVGIAGGVDKNAKNLKAWTEIGYGFLEIGTVTPRPQNANPGKTVDRIWKYETLWNKLGFPNDGVDCIKLRLSKYFRQKKTPLFVNIGKNRDTPNEKAYEDYIQLIKELKDVADVFVINISSPNTSDLRELLKKENLEKFLSPIAQTAEKQMSKLLLKLSPDMDENDMKNVIDVSIKFNLAGWILTNSTVEKPTGSHFPEGGGVTGRPLQMKSRDFLKKFLFALGENRHNRLIVSVGGILDAEEAEIRFQLGADLVQVYSALIFRGPNFVKVLRHHHHCSSGI